MMLRYNIIYLYVYVGTVQPFLDVIINNKEIIVIKMTSRAFGTFLYIALLESRTHSEIIRVRMRYRNYFSDTHNIIYMRSKTTILLLCVMRA